MNKIFGVILFCISFTVSGASFYTMEKADVPLCEYSSVLPNMGWFSGDSDRDVRMLSYGAEFSYYKKRFSGQSFSNFNSLTTTRMSQAFGFSPKKLNIIAEKLDYRRNAYERYSVIRLMARKKIEKIILGIDEAVNYLRWSPRNHPEFGKSKIGWLKSFFSNDAQTNMGNSYEALNEIPKSCLVQDPYIKDLKESLIAKRKKQLNQKNRNSNAKSMSKIYSNLTNTAKIYPFEKQKSLLSLQKRLKNSYLEIEKLKNLQSKLRDKEVKRLKEFRYFMSQGYRLLNLKSMQSSEVVKEFVKSNQEFDLWRNHVLLLFASETLRKKNIKNIQSDQLAQALLTLPHGNDITKESWEKAQAFLENKADSIEDQILEVLSLNPILVLDYNKGLGEMTLIDWLESNPNELKPSSLESFSSIFDEQIQIALVHNVIRFQKPALEKTCEFLNMNPNELICPEDNIELQKLILNEPLLREVQKDNGWMTEASSNILVDHYVTSSKEMNKTLVEVGVLTVATLGVGTVLAAIGGGARLALLAHATNTASKLNKIKLGAETFLTGKKISEINRMAHTGLNFYLLGSAVNSVNTAWNGVIRSEEDAHTNIENMSWGSLKSAENAWTNFYISASVATTMGILTKVQLSRFTNESLTVKNGVAFIKGKIPAPIINLLKNAGIKIAQSKPYQLVTKISDNIKVFTDAFKRTIDKTVNINAGTKEGTLQAEIITDKAAAQFQRIDNLYVGKAVTELPSRMPIIRDGKLLSEEWSLTTKDGIINFTHKSTGTELELSNRFFEIIEGASQYALKVRPGVAWAGMSRGLSILESIPGGTNNMQYALLRTGLNFPLSSIKWLSGLIGGGLKLAVGTTIVSATGLSLYIKFFVTNGILGAAKEFENYIPPSWSGTKKTLTQLIGRWEKDSINEAERKATERELTMHHKVRSVLDTFQNSTNRVEDSLTQMEMNKWYIEEYISRLRNTKNTDDKALLLVQLKGFVDRQNYYLNRFPTWIKQIQRDINYNAQAFIFFNENQRLFEKYWDDFYDNREKNGLANEFNLQKRGETVIMKYGMWIGSHPYTGESTEELRTILNLVETNKDIFTDLINDIEVEFDFSISKLGSEFDTTNRFQVEKKGLRQKVEKSSVSSSLVHSVNFANQQIEQKLVSLKGLEQSFMFNYDLLIKGSATASQLEIAKKRLIGTVERLYTLSMRDLFQWKWHIKDLLETKLFEIRSLESAQRYKIKTQVKEISNGNIILKEKQTQNGIVLSLNSGYFRISTSMYEDNRRMKKFDINFEDRIIEIERKVLELKARGIIDPNQDLELTSY